MVYQMHSDHTSDHWWLIIHIQILMTPTPWKAHLWPFMELLSYWTVIQTCNSHRIYAGTVMTSFHYASTTTHGNWFQTNQPEHESDDSASDRVIFVCITNEKDMALQQQIWSTFVTVLWCSQTKITDRTRILILMRVFWDMISKIYWQFWHSFFKNVLESSYNFNRIAITWRKMVRSVCLKPVSMGTWRLHTLSCFTVPVYSSIDVPFKIIKSYEFYCAL